MSRETLLQQATRFRRFVIVGVLTACVDIGVMQGLLLAGLDPLAARAVSLPLAMVCAWRLNRSYTFGASGRSQPEEALRYAAVATLAALTNYLVFAGLLRLVPGLWPALAAACGIGTSMWVSFFGFQLFTFSRRNRTPAN